MAHLVDYITRDNDGYIVHNFYGLSRDELVSEFLENAALLEKRKNGNYYYHEIISITRSSQIPEAEQKRLFEQLIQEYIASRCPDCLVLAGLHDEKDSNLHYHLMISANRVSEKKRFYLNKKAFDEVKRGLERYTNEKFPELEQGRVIDKQRGDEKLKLSQKEVELKKRTKKASKKEQLHEFLSDALQYSADKTEFLTHIEKLGFTLEYRGKNARIIDAQGKAHRLSTLGLQGAYESLGEQSTDAASNKQTKETPQTESARNFEANIRQAIKTSESRQDYFAQLTSSDIFYDQQSKTFIHRQENTKLSAHELGIEAELLRLETYFSEMEHLSKEDTIERMHFVIASSHSPAQHSALLHENGLFMKKDGDRYLVYNNTTNTQYSLQDLGLETSYTSLLKTLDAGKPSKSKQAVDEWLFGDFSTREAETRKKRAEQEREKDAEVQDWSELSRSEKIGEVAREWIQGDFQNREARQRNKQREEHLQAWKKESAIESSPNKSDDIAKKKAEFQNIREQQANDRNHDKSPDKSR
ncbi:MAG: hypothetical protein HWE20_03840 [Gammaproteobacteria bacterium]|nr:hypothetical protein [Gammaproteobacteria bacterium]